MSEPDTYWPDAVAHQASVLKEQAEAIQRLTDELARAKRGLYKMPVTYGNADTLDAMIDCAQDEMARRTLSLNETQSELARAREQIEHLEWTFVPEDGQSTYDQLKAELQQARAEAQAMREVVEAVNERHVRIDEGENEGFCLDCDHAWPCPTANTLARLDSASSQTCPDCGDSGYAEDSPVGPVPCRNPRHRLDSASERSQP